MLLDYAPILILTLLVLAFAAGNLVISDVLGGKRKSIAKGTAYECGMSERPGNTTGDTGARVRLSIHFYLVAVSFIVFDVEAIFLIPWAVAAKQFQMDGIGLQVFGLVSFFLLVLAVGLAYEWRKGGLDWDR
jgi:NADH-quinone oxidoreductase subunit A